MATDRFAAKLMKLQSALVTKLDKAITKLASSLPDESSDEGQGRSQSFDELPLAPSVKKEVKQAIERWKTENPDPPPGRRSIDDLGLSLETRLSILEAVRKKRAEQLCGV